MSEEKKLQFVTEGQADVEKQSEREDAIQGAIETERKKRVRKTLRDQLRANAIKKQKKSNRESAEVKKLNQLSKEETRYFKELEKNREQEIQRLTQFHKDKDYEYEKKRQQLLSRSPDKQSGKPNTLSSNQNNGSTERVILKVKKNKNRPRLVVKK